MKNLYLLVAIVGILILSLFLVFAKPIEINNLQDLEKLNNNQKVITKSKVIYQKGQLITLENKLKLYCEKCNAIRLQNKTVQITAIKTSFPKDNSLTVLKIN